MTDQVSARANRSRIAIAVAGIASVAAAAIAFAVTRGGDEPANEPIPPGSGMAMCVEMYSPDTIVNREIAFDGTVDSVDGDTITFTVGEWFRGGDAATTSLEGAGTLGGLTSVGDGVQLEPGSRLLVSGDDGFAWNCGFTQPYDEGVAAAWRSTFR